MTLLPKDIRDVKKMTKSELLQAERKINKSMDNIYDKGIKDEVYLGYEAHLKDKHPEKAISIESVVTKFVKEKSRIKRYIYDCDYCADAKFTRKVDKQTGEDTDYYKGDCGQPKCKYETVIKESVSDTGLNAFDEVIKKLLID